MLLSKSCTKLIKSWSTPIDIFFVTWRVLVLFCLKVTYWWIKKLSTKLQNSFACRLILYYSAIILQIKYTNELYCSNMLYQLHCMRYQWQCFYLWISVLHLPHSLIDKVTDSRFIHSTYHPYLFLPVGFLSHLSKSILRDVFLRNPGCFFQLTDPVHRNHRRAQLHAGIKGLQSLRSSLERDTR